MSTSLRSGSSKPPSKTMSTSVRRLQEALNMHLDVKEKSKFVEALNKFHISRDVPKFVKNLKKILDTPAKKQIFGLIRKVIPQIDLEEFDRWVQAASRKFDTVPAKRSKYLQRKARMSLPATEVAKKLPKQMKLKSRVSRSTEDLSRGSDSSRSTKDTLGGHTVRSIKSLKSAMKDPGSEVKHIQIKQPPNSDQGFGFSIRGGAEFGLGIYVSLVDSGGAAEKQGLVPGDLVTEVNDVSFSKVTHSDAAQIIRSARKLDMKVCRVGRIPGTFVVHQMYKWVDPHGRQVPPPPELEHLGQTDTLGRKSGFSLLKAADECKVNVKVGERQNLGLMIRGGREFGLGIYISGVDPFSLADEAGLKVGDQILDVNGKSFLDITHAEAARLLKVGDQILDVNGKSFLDITHAEAARLLKVIKQLMFTIKDVGKLPYARTKIDQTNWLNNQPAKPRRRRTESQNSDSTVVSSGSAFSKGVGSQLMLNTTASTSAKWDSIQNQASELLNETERGSLRYYLSEYRRGFITVDGLVMASFELLNTRAKMTMMSDIRNWVRPRDIDKFDVLLQRREARQQEGFLSNSFNGRSFRNSGRMGHNHGVHIRTTMSAPASRAATMRSRPPRRPTTARELEMEPLRQAIEQIEDDPDFYTEDHGMPLESSRLRSVSSDQLHSPNLLKTSVPSRRSLSQETLTPVYIDTTSELPQTRPSSGKSASQRSRSTNASQRPRLNSYSHRQRSGSNSSTLRRRHKSVEDVRMTPPSPGLSRRELEAESRRRLSQPSFTHLPYDSYDDEDPEYPEEFPVSGTISLVQAEVHTHPRPGEGVPSDDSGVEVNGHHNNEANRSFSSNFSMRQKRVTISAENPVSIDDVLENRSTVSMTTDLDLANHSNNNSNSSTLISRRSRSDSRSTLTSQQSRSGSTLTSQQSRSGRNSRLGYPSVTSLFSNTSSQGANPPEIRINDGEGSIDSMLIDNPTSPKFISQSPMHFRGSSVPSQEVRRKGQTFSIRGQNSYDADDEPETFDVHSDVGDSDLYVSPLDRVLDEEGDSYSDVSIVSHRSYHESKQIADARRRYGNIPLDVVPIYKTKPTLGVAIEGGANTRQPLPRVINLQPGGSAYESGGLKVGHVILEVNGRSLVGLEHITAAKAIAEAFKNKAHDHMELLITESGVNVKMPS